MDTTSDDIVSDNLVALETVLSSFSLTQCNANALSQNSNMLEADEDEQFHCSAHADMTLGGHIMTDK